MAILIALALFSFLMISITVYDHRRYVRPSRGSSTVQYAWIESMSATTAHSRDWFASAPVWQCCWISLLSAVWFGLNFANSLVAPIRRLIHATDQVAMGNFYVQVPIRRREGDLAHLGKTFNKMTAELSRQHGSLTAASDLIDRRRRFTDADLGDGDPGHPDEHRIKLPEEHELSL